MSNPDRKFIEKKFMTKSQNMDESNKIWDKRAEEFYEMTKTDQEDEIITYFKRKASISGMSILDIGCGSGRFLSILLSEGAKVEGLEPSVEMVKFAKKHLNESGYEDINIPIYNQPFQDFQSTKIYDYIFSSNTPIPFSYENYEKILQIAKKGIIISSWLYREDSIFSDVSKSLGKKVEIGGNNSLYYLANLLNLDGYFPSIETFTTTSQSKVLIKNLINRYSHWLYGPNYSEEEYNQVKDQLLKRANDRGEILQKRVSVKGILFCSLENKRT